MSHVRAVDIRGLEYDWLARDAGGSVALFCTAGGGYAPPAFLTNAAAHDVAIDSILAMPPLRPGSFSVAHIDEYVWRGLVDRGVYVFDSDAAGGDYRQIGVPERALNVDAFPAAVREVAILFPDIRFAATSTVDAQHELRPR